MFFGFTFVTYTKQAHNTIFEVTEEFIFFFLSIDHNFWLVVEIVLYRYMFPEFWMINKKFRVIHMLKIVFLHLIISNRSITIQVFTITIRHPFFQIHQIWYNAYIRCHTWVIKFFTRFFVLHCQMFLLFLFLII